MTTTLNPTITITVSGPTGSGKSRVLALIADALKLIHGDKVIIDSPELDSERRMSNADYTTWHSPRSGTIFKLEEINLPESRPGRTVRDMSYREALAWFAQYQFQDATGHSLTMCGDFHELLDMALNHDQKPDGNTTFNVNEPEYKVKTSPGIPPRITLRRKSVMEGYHGLGEWDDTQVWVEPGYKPELRVSLASAYAGYLQRDREGFWVPLFHPDGSALGWIKFSATGRIHGQFHFSATEFRPATEPAPKMGDLVQEGIHWPVPDNKINVTKKKTTVDAKDSGEINEVISC
ncbi:hypothetical protein [Citrobacter braakii]|uniref:Uncharacterized protein n=1 Tax=Citrobacter braakii TaxID=57706 RepID=A0A1V8NW62_CITBR|nr:hypothetical protein [Citrobacter braakii]OQM40557.1 hypothetical protein BZK42_18525 [Citrobacter braakii]QXC18197.1 hypothetical protein I6L51_09085 [Citrobacter braakii]